MVHCLSHKERWDGALNVTGKSLFVAADVPHSVGQLGRSWPCAPSNMFLHSPGKEKPRDDAITQRSPSLSCSSGWGRVEYSLLQLLTFSGTEVDPL